METQELLRLESISKSFPGVQALDRVSMTVQRGEVHALVGENGAGKSTLMKIISGAFAKDAGRIYLRGSEIEIRGPKHARDLGISTIYQEFYLVPGLTVSENILLGRTLEKGALVKRVDREKQAEKARAILRDLGVDIDPFAPVKSLNVAMQQMVEIAKALSGNADIIIMDEPTAALSHQEVSTLFKVIGILKSQGKSVIYISHRLDEIPQVADRVTVLRDGCVAGAVDSPKERGAMERIIFLMLGRELSNKYPVRPSSVGTEEALRVEDLCLADILQDVSLTVHRGEILGIVGLLGSGTTELSRLLFGAEMPTKGRIRVFGREVRIDSPKRAIALGIGFLPEDRKRYGLVLPMSVMENIILASLAPLSTLLKLRQGAIRQVTNRFIQDLGIRTPNPRQKTAQLSGGNQQKVVLAKWLCSKSRIVVFSEPTRGVDVGAKLEVYQLIVELVKEGAAVIIVSSDLDEVVGMSDRIMVIRRGRVVREVTRAQANRDALLADATGGSEHMTGA